MLPAVGDCTLGRLVTPLPAVRPAGQPQPPGARALGWGGGVVGCRGAAERVLLLEQADATAALAAHGPQRPALTIQLGAPVQIVLISQTVVIAATFAILFSGLDPAKPGGIQDEIRCGAALAGGWGWQSIHSAVEAEGIGCICSLRALVARACMWHASHGLTVCLCASPTSASPAICLPQPALPERRHSGDELE